MLRLAFFSSACLGREAIRVQIAEVTAQLDEDQAKGIFALAREFNQAVPMYQAAGGQAAAAALAADGAVDADGERSCASSRLPALMLALDGARLLATPHAVSWNQSQLLTVHVADGATAAYNIPMAHWLRRGAGGGGV